MPTFFRDRRQPAVQPAQRQLVVTIGIRQQVSAHLSRGTAIHCPILLSAVHTQLEHPHTLVTAVAHSRDHADIDF